MRFLDSAKVYVRSGNGGAGCVSFRREKFVEFGGPDGGDGGRGGDVIVEAVAGLNTMIDFRYRQHFKARSGAHGMGSNRTGAAGADEILEVPAGTQILDAESETQLADLERPGDRVVLLRGGRGGRGNARFKSSTNRAPRRADPGETGEECWIRLQLKLIADAGLLGLPNAGKSTFLSAVSRARPKVADYPFTTLVPTLGTVYVDDAEFVLTDIPGLIEGAHAGTGLGHRFLAHVERCSVLLHLVDGTADDVVGNWRTIRRELERYDDGLAARTEVLALSKIDALTAGEAADRRRRLEAASAGEVFPVSAVAGTGVTGILRRLAGLICAARPGEAGTAGEAAPWTP